MAHAQREYPRESCGLFVEDGDGVAYLPMENLHPTPEAAFEMSAAAYREHAHRVHGVVHSHPQPQFGPSHADMQSQLETAVPHYIVVVPHGNYADFFGWGDQLPTPPLLGRTFRAGVTDCYAAVRHYQFRVRGVLWPDWPRDYEWWNPEDGSAETENPLLLHVQDPRFETVPSVEELRVGDGILFDIRAGQINHCGVYAGQGLLYHHLHGKISRRDPLVQWTRFARHIVRFKDAGAT